MAEAGSAEQPDRHASSARRGDIQGLRAIAVLVVVIYHAGVGLPGGFIGVDVFFVISGYVIARMLLTELSGTGGVSLRRFYLRRVRRLLPALGLLLTSVLILSVLFVPLAAQQVTARTGVGAALLNANTYLIRYSSDGGYFGVGAASNALLHTWSLSVEEQFYLVFPALLVLAWVLAAQRGANPRLAVGVLLGVIVVVSFPLSWMFTTEALDPGGVGTQIAFYSSLTRAWEFAAGGLLAVFAGRAALLAPKRAATVGVIGAALVVVATLFLSESTQFPGTAVLLPVLGTFMLIAAGESPATSALTRVLSARSLQWVGDRSYSWYLWHWPLIVFAATLWPSSAAAKSAAAVLSLIPAWLSYRLVESPIRSKPKPLARRTMALAALCVVLPLIGAMGLEVGHRLLSRSDRIAPFSLHLDKAHNCESSTPFGNRDLTSCLWSTEASTGLAVLIGDSNAGQFTEGLVAGANEAGLDAAVATHYACPFIDLRWHRDGVEDVSCRNFVTQSVADLAEMRPAVVVIVSASPAYINSDDEFRSPDGATTYRTPEEKAGAWRGGLERLIEPIRSADIAVIVVHPVPYLTPGWRPYGMAPIRLLGTPASINTTIDRYEASQVRAAAFVAEIAAAKATTSLTLDVFDEMCPAETCSAFDGTTWRYLDSGHISVAASESLSPRFGEILKVAVSRG